MAKYLDMDGLAEVVRLSNLKYEKSANKTTSIGNNPSGNKYPTEKLLDEERKKFWLTSSDLDEIMNSL